MPGPVVVAVGLMACMGAVSGDTNVGCANRICETMRSHAWLCGSDCLIDDLHGCSKWKHKCGLCYQDSWNHMLPGPGPVAVAVYSMTCKNAECSR